MLSFDQFKIHHVFSVAMYAHFECIYILEFVAGNAMLSKISDCLIYPAPPMLLDGFNSTTLNITYPLTLTCIFYGDPVPTVEWYFQGEQQSEAVQIHTGNGMDIFIVADEGGPGSGESGDTNLNGGLLITSTLSLAHVGIENEGVYVCNATNGVPNFIGSVTSHNSTIKVQGNNIAKNLLPIIMHNDIIISVLLIQFLLK